MHKPVHLEAERLCRAHVSCLPIRADGTKRPLLAWKRYQTRLPTEYEVARWFVNRAVGIAVIAGVVSDNLEIIDFDAPMLFKPWHATVEELSPGLLHRLPIVRTPTGGCHIYYRCEGIQHNLKLAQHLGPDGRPVTLIETRGEGGYTIIPPSPPACHPLQRPYMLVQGDLAAIPTITAQQRLILLNAARSFNQYVKPQRVECGPSLDRLRAGHGQKRRLPGDDYNARGDWSPLLLGHGWTMVGQRGSTTLWKRPGKREPGCSATTNHADRDLLYVFSTNAHPFQHNTAYTKFAAYALLHHGGDFRAAAGALAASGYGGAGKRHARLDRRTRLSNGLWVGEVMGVPAIRTVAATEVAAWRG
jgi:hypothetical protein